MLWSSVCGYVNDLLCPVLSSGISIDSFLCQQIRLFPVLMVAIGNYIGLNVLKECYLKSQRRATGCSLFSFLNSLPMFLYGFDSDRFGGRELWNRHQDEWRMKTGNVLGVFILVISSLHTLTLFLVVDEHWEHNDDRQRSIYWLWSR